MMHQRVERHVRFSRRPQRKTIIEKDEIVGMKIDVEVLSTDEFYVKYFSVHPMSHEEEREE